MEARAAGFNPRTYSDLNGSAVASRDITEIYFRKPWIFLVLRGARIKMPAHAVFNLALVRATVWVQSRAVFVSNGGPRRWREWVAARVSPLGVVVKALPRRKRYRESEDAED
jgi:hypothetical protein